VTSNGCFNSDVIHASCSTVMAKLPSPAITPEYAVFAQPMGHLHRRPMPSSNEITTHPRSPVNLSTKKCATSYKSDYPLFPSLVYKQQQATNQSQTLKNRPHPSNLYYLKRLDTNEMVCDIKTDSITHDIFGAPLDNPTMSSNTCTRETFRAHSNISNRKVTRYGSNKLPAVGIIPITTDARSLKKSRSLQIQEDHWLPGTLGMTTKMTMHAGPYQYLPRKRKQILLDFTAAGILGMKNQTDDHRYHFELKKRGNVSPYVTVRSGI